MSEMTCDYCHVHRNCIQVATDVRQFQLYIFRVIKVKSIFTSEAKQELHLGAVNSINWARILAQIVYYFFSAFQTCKLKKCDKVVFSVPTGNFGDILAGYYAKLMGAPISKLIVASNSNDILPRYKFASYMFQPIKW